jgi:hypothetical protein
LVTDQKIGDLWRRVDPFSVYRPSWRNTASVSGFRWYTGGAAILTVEGEVLRLRVRWPRLFIVVFAGLFLPAFAAIAWFMIPDPALRWLFTIGGTFVGALTFCFIYALQSYHQGLGDYLVVDGTTKTVRLPRVKKEFCFSHVAGFQWIRGRTKSFVNVEVDLNLLVSESGDVVRYHVMGNPSRRMIEQVLCFSGLSLEEIDLGRRGFRDADIDTLCTTTNG